MANKDTYKVLRSRSMHEWRAIAKLLLCTRDMSNTETIGTVYHSSKGRP